MVVYSPWIQPKELYSHRFTFGDGATIPGMCQVGHPRYLPRHPWNAWQTTQAVCPTTGTMTVPSFKPLKPMRIDFQPKYGMLGLFERCGWWSHSFTPFNFHKASCWSEWWNEWWNWNRLNVEYKASWWKCVFNIYILFASVYTACTVEGLFDISMSF